MNYKNNHIYRQFFRDDYGTKKRIDCDNTQLKTLESDDLDYLESLIDLINSNVNEFSHTLKLILEFTQKHGFIDENDVILCSNLIFLCINEIENICNPKDTENAIKILHSLCIPDRTCYAIAKNRFITVSCQYLQKKFCPCMDIVLLILINLILTPKMSEFFHNFNFNAVFEVLECKKGDSSVIKSGFLFLSKAITLLDIGEPNQIANDINELINNQFIFDDDGFAGICMTLAQLMKKRLMSVDFFCNSCIYGFVLNYFKFDPNSVLMLLVETLIIDPHFDVQINIVYFCEKFTQSIMNMEEKRIVFFSLFFSRLIEQDSSIIDDAIVYEIIFTMFSKIHSFGFFTKSIFFHFIVQVMESSFVSCLVGIDVLTLISFFKEMDPLSMELDLMKQVFRTGVGSLLTSYEISGKIDYYVEFKEYLQTHIDNNTV